MKLIKLMNNFHSVEGENFTIYFSYETPIAFTLNGVLTIRENDWKQTTGKHLNYIDENKENRIKGAEFLDALRNLQIQGAY